MKKNTDEVISKISYHSIKKFELIESYVSRWSRILVNNGYYPSREKASQAIKKGIVEVDGKIILKPSTPTTLEAKINILEEMLTVPVF